MCTLNPITDSYLKILEVVSVIMVAFGVKPDSLFSSQRHAAEPPGRLRHQPPPHGGPTTINALISNNGIRLQTRSQLTPVFPTTTSINSILAVRFTSLSRIPMIGMTPSPIRTFITTQIRSIPTEIFMAV